MENFWSLWSGLGCFERSGVVWSILKRPDEVEIGSDICMSNIGVNAFVYEVFTM